MTKSSISQGKICACVDSQGAQLTSLSYDGTEYLWQADERWWPRQAPVLFPIVGNLRADAATSTQGRCQMGRHGLARTLGHTLVSQTDSSLTYRLESTDETRGRYPYDFRLEMTYALEEGRSLRQTFSVTNTGTVELPFFVGGHPAFNVPLAQGEAFEDYELRFSRPWSATSPIVVDGGLWDYGTQVELLDQASVLPLGRHLFAHDTIVLADVPDATVTLMGPAGKGMRVDFEGFDHLGIWSAANSADGEPAPFVAIEPWCGTATRTDEDDVFEHKQNLLVAKPGETITKSFLMTPL